MAKGGEGGYCMGGYKLKNVQLREIKLRVENWTLSIEYFYAISK